jgi:hypothetical protein
MEKYSETFKEYQILKTYSRRIRVPIITLKDLGDRKFRGHLMSLHQEGRPLSELTDYLASFHNIKITPQQLRKTLQLTGGDTWKEAASSYRQHRHMKKQERIISALST